MMHCVSLFETVVSSRSTLTMSFWRDVLSRERPIVIPGTTAEEAVDAQQSKPQQQQQIQSQETDVVEDVSNANSHVSRNCFIIK